MIASLHGKIEAINADSAVINVNGIGFQVYVSTTTLTSLGAIGQETSLTTHLVVREDSLNLYGFSTKHELDLFKILIGVSGLGPRLALAMLSAMNVEQVGSAITSENINLLTTIPGIGKKMANRIVLELKDKIGASLLDMPASPSGDDTAEVIGALTSLGYSIAEASRAAANLPSGDMSLEDKIKTALQSFNE